MFPQDCASFAFRKRSAVSNKTDFDRLFPDSSQTSKQLAASHPRTFRCPNGHDLPHRVTWGRCSPLECADFAQPGVKAEKTDMDLRPFREEMKLKPRGLEALSFDADAEDIANAELLQSRSREAVAIMRSEGQRQARHAMHPFPEIPSPPPVGDLGVKEWVKQRLDNASMYAIESAIWDLKYGTPAERRAAREEILDRSGNAPRKQEGSLDVRSPVIVVNIGDATPYDKQKEKRHEKALNEGPRKDRDR